MKLWNNNITVSLIFFCEQNLLNALSFKIFPITCTDTMKWMIFTVNIYRINSMWLTAITLWNCRIKKRSKTWQKLFCVSFEAFCPLNGSDSTLLPLILMLGGFSNLSTGQHCTNVVQLTEMDEDNNSNYLRYFINVSNEIMRLISVDSIADGMLSNIKCGFFAQEVFFCSSVISVFIKTVYNLH